MTTRKEFLEIIGCSIAALVGVKVLPEKGESVHVTVKHGSFTHEAETDVNMPVQPMPEDVIKMAQAEIEQSPFGITRDGRFKRWKNNTNVTYKQGELVMAPPKLWWFNCQGKPVYR